MTTAEWIWVCAFGSAALFVGLGWAAFYPAWPPVDEGGRHRPDSNPANPPKPAPEPESDPVPLEPTAESWMWDAGAWPRSRPRHRWENIGEGTQRIPWYDKPTAPPPVWPPYPPVE